MHANKLGVPAGNRKLVQGIERKPGGVDKAEKGRDGEGRMVDQGEEEGGSSGTRQYPSPGPDLLTCLYLPV